MEAVVGGAALFVLLRHVNACWRSSIALDPYIALLLPALLLLVMPAILVEGSSLSAVAMVGILAVSALVFVNPAPLRAPFRFTKRLQPAIALRFLYVLAGLHLACTVMPALEVIRQFGFAGAYQRDRLTAHFESGIFTGSAIASLRLISEISFYVCLGLLFTRGRRVLALFLFLIYIVSLTLFASTRLSIVLPILGFGCFYVYVRGMGRKTIALSAALFALVLPWYVFVTNAIRHGLDVSFELGANVWEFGLQEIDYNKYIDHAIQYAKLHDFEYGYGWLLGSFGNIVPRFLWSAKPVTSISNRFTELVTGDAPSLMNPVMTFTVFGEGYLQFGYIGVLVESLLFAAVFAKIFWTFMSHGNPVGALAGFNIATIALIYFRAEVPFIQLLFAFLTLWLFVSAGSSMVRIDQTRESRA